MRIPDDGGQGENPHAHIMLTTRTLTPEGFGNKNRTWNKKEHLVLKLDRPTPSRASRHVDRARDGVRFSEPEVDQPLFGNRSYTSSRSSKCSRMAARMLAAQRGARRTRRSAGRWDDAASGIREGARVGATVEAGRLTGAIDAIRGDASIVRRHRRELPGVSGGSRDGLGGRDRARVLLRIQTGRTPTDHVAARIARTAQHL